MDKVSIVLLLCVIIATAFAQIGSRNRPTYPSEPDIIVFPHSAETQEKVQSHSSHFHQKDHLYHQHETTTRTEIPDTDSLETEVKIPLDLIRRLNSVQNVSELFDNFIMNGSSEDDYRYDGAIATRFGIGGVERSAAIMPKPAVCMPELKTISLVDSDDPSVFYFPSCTRVKRCGGCCSHSLLACQPTQSETRTFQIIKSQFGGGSQLSYKGKQNVLIEEHTKCKCDCATKEEHCNQFQEYRKAECRCACTNLDEEKKCHKDNDTKLWDPNTCVCRCREAKDCSSGLYFDQNQCKCLQIPIRRRLTADGVTSSDGFGTEDRRRYIVKAVPIPIIPAAQNKYDTGDEEDS